MNTYEEEVTTSVEWSWTDWGVDGDGEELLHQCVQLYDYRGDSVAIFHESEIPGTWPFKDKQWVPMDVQLRIRKEVLQHRPLAEDGSEYRDDSGRLYRFLVSEPCVCTYADGLCIEKMWRGGLVSSKNPRHAAALAYLDKRAPEEPKPEAVTFETTLQYWCAEDDSVSQLCGRKVSLSPGTNVRVTVTPIGFDAGARQR